MINYVGDSLNVSFDINMDDKPARVLQATGKVFNPRGEVAYSDMARAKGDNVSFSVPGKAITIAGEYTMYFSLLVQNYGNLTHVVKKKVKRLPVGEKIASQVR